MYIFPNSLRKITASYEQIEVKGMFDNFYSLRSFSSGQLLKSHFHARVCFLISLISLPMFIKLIASNKGWSCVYSRKPGVKMTLVQFCGGLQTPNGLLLKTPSRMTIVKGIEFKTSIIFENHIIASTHRQTAPSEDPPLFMIMSDNNRNLFT